MNLPDTHNANHQYAFKKGYRLALEGKPLTQMPNPIKTDPQMRDYFQQGWQAFQEEVANAEEERESPWRNRFTWIFMSILAGIGTATLIIRDIETTREKQNQTLDPVEQLLAERPEVVSLEEPPKVTNELSLSNPQLSDPPSLNTINLSLIDRQPSSASDIEPRASESTGAPRTDNKPRPEETFSESTESKQVAQTTLAEEQSNPITFSLLTDEQRNDLTLNKQEENNKRLLKPNLVSSTIEIKHTVFTNNIIDTMPQSSFEDLIPKHVRKVYFFTQILNAKGKTLYHRWWHNGQIMETVPLKIQSSDHRTWSSKQLTSAWAGKWTVDLLDESQQPIYRQTFHYIKGEQ